jgi:hypothetical protein
VLATRNSQLPACRRCRLRTHICVAHDHANACHIDALGQRAPTSVAGPWPRGMGSVAGRKKQTRFGWGAQIFSLLSELASDQRQPTHRPSGYLFSFLCLALLPCFFFCSWGILTSSCFASTYCSFIELNRHLSATTPPPAPEIYRTTTSRSRRPTANPYTTGIISWDLGLRF